MCKEKQPCAAKVKEAKYEIGVCDRNFEILTNKMIQKIGEFVSLEKKFKKCKIENGELFKTNVENANQITSLSRNYKDINIEYKKLIKQYTNQVNINKQTLKAHLSIKSKIKNRLDKITELILEPDIKETLIDSDQLHMIKLEEKYNKSTDK